MNGHQQSGTPEYKAWHNMKTRCYNPNTPYYADYGGRGIRVCERWLDDPLNFIADMGPRPGPGYSLNRIDNEYDYTPDNCEWATAIEQAANRRSRTPPLSKAELAKIAEAVDLCYKPESEL